MTHHFDDVIITLTLRDFRPDFGSLTFSHASDLLSPTDDFSTVSAHFSSTLYLLVYLLVSTGVLHAYCIPLYPLYGT